MESHGEDKASTSSDSLGEQLYKLVDIYNTGLTEKITGMLLEQKKQEVQKLLSDPGLLEERVNIALKTLEEQSPEETDVSDSSDPDDTEKLGERLFEVVHQIDAVRCADITGMLLEMDHGMLRQVLSDQVMLEMAVQKAQSALLEHGGHTPPWNTTLSSGTHSSESSQT
ncbi:embryonic polyadenylate-binding protein A [Megalops cyprinoides]|uniref:embryonic polyadenylate-binding protein A n=1 Tax=Megalops cyprinoides TaxID=118141 RepID=UPI001864F7FD|nr:embryonic polyadenylate-binding protein A [Megalops cyprinoides]